MQKWSKQVNKPLLYMERKRVKEWKIHEKVTKLFSFKLICYLSFSKKTTDDSFIAIIRDYLKKIYSPSPPAFSRARITRAHYRDFELFAFTTFTQRDYCIAILKTKKQGYKTKNVGDFLEKVQRFSENLPRFWRKVREVFLGLRIYRNRSSNLWNHRNLWNHWNHWNHWNSLG